ncbi:MAG: roadblock/LC7 domain-containing protein [Anaerolineae bacterium]|nr:roadblock/LC7 domain-containing protein [Anaerolineae bacterium]
MDWFNRLAGNRYIQLVLLANDQGQMLRASREIQSEDDVLPSMLQALEVLGQSLSDEFNCGTTHMVHLSTARGHIMLFPLAGSQYYLAVLVEKIAPLMVVLVEIERTLKALNLDELADLNPAAELDAAELIEAVREWLQAKDAE